MPDVKRCSATQAATSCEESSRQLANFGEFRSSQPCSGAQEMLGRDRRKDRASRLDSARKYCSSLPRSLDALELMLVDVEASDLGLERRAWNAELHGCASRAEHATAAVRQSSYDHLPLTHLVHAAEPGGS